MKRILLRYPDKDSARTYLAMTRSNLGYITVATGEYRLIKHHHNMTISNTLSAEYVNRMTKLYSTYYLATAGN